MPDPRRSFLRGDLSILLRLALPPGDDLVVGLGNFATTDRKTIMELPKAGPLGAL